jgi:hypothetical protein
VPLFLDLHQIWSDTFLWVRSILISHKTGLNISPIFSEALDPRPPHWRKWSYHYTTFYIRLGFKFSLGRLQPSTSLPSTCAYALRFTKNPEPSCHFLLFHGNVMSINTFPSHLCFYHLFLLWHFFELLVWCCLFFRFQAHVVFVLRG